MGGGVLGVERTTWVWILIVIQLEEIEEEEVDSIIYI
jgi:hypothetical protein